MEGKQCSRLFHYPSSSHYNNAANQKPTVSADQSDPGSAGRHFHIFGNSCKAIILCGLFFYYFCPYPVTWLTPPTISHLLSNNILFRKLIINISGSYYEAEAVYIINILRHIVSRSIKRPPNSSHSTQFLDIFYSEKIWLPT